MSPEAEKQAPYVHQSYPRMLFWGKVQEADTEQDPKSTLTVNNPEEEKAALKTGWKKTKKSKPGTPKELADSERELAETQEKLAKATAELEELQAKQRIEEATEDAQEQAEKKADSAAAEAKKAEKESAG